MLEVKTLLVSGRKACFNLDVTALPSSSENELNNHNTYTLFLKANSFGRGTLRRFEMKKETVALYYSPTFFSFLLPTFYSC